MTGSHDFPNDDFAADDLHELFDQLPDVSGIDPEELAGTAIRRGRQRRAHRQRGLVAASCALLVAVALPALATDDHDQALDTAGHSSELDVPRSSDEPRKSPTDDTPKTTTTTQPGETEPTTTTTDGALEPVEPDPTTTTVAHHDEPAPTTTTTAPKKPDVEPLELWCARGSGEEAGGVVCESSVSEHDDFAGYRLYRRCIDGGDWELAATYDQRTMPNRPWPDIRWFDPEVDPGYGWLYKVVVVDHEGHFIGVSNKATVPAVDGADAADAPAD